MEIIQIIIIIFWLGKSSERSDDRNHRRNQFVEKNEAPQFIEKNLNNVSSGRDITVRVRRSPRFAKEREEIIVKIRRPTQEKITLIFAGPSFVF